MKMELVFIPPSAVGHLVSTVQIAKLLVDRDDHLFVTVLIIPPRLDSPSSYVNPLNLSSNDRLRYINLPRLNPDNDATRNLIAYMGSQKPHVREAVAKIVDSPESPRLAGFVFDMFSLSLMDVADEFGVPSYMFFTCNASFLATQFHVQFLYDEQNFDVTELKDSGTDLSVPCLSHPYPAKYFPTTLLDKEGFKTLLEQTRKFRQMKGIMVNTFTELEPHALKFLSDGNTPPVYPVGPVLNLQTDGQDSKGESAREKLSEIMKWLDDQPRESVVFLCFGSMGGFEEDQVREIAQALERSGHRFLWSLRQASRKGTMPSPGEYANLEEVLPEGFLDRTAGIGKIIGWAPQVVILGHPSVGGFVSHCGWNSILESLHFGVPIATWPLYAEQQFNAFQMVVELGLAVEIKMDHRIDLFIKTDMREIVRVTEIERGIRCLMDYDNEVRTRVKVMSEKSRTALMDGGSSLVASARFIQDVADNLS